MAAESLVGVRTGLHAAVCAVSRTRTRRVALAAAISLAATVAWMWPLISHLESRILLGPSDAASAIRDYWQAEHQGKTPFTVSHDRLVGAPEGEPDPSAQRIAQPIQPGVIWLLRHVFGLVGAFNLFILAGFVLTGTAAYLFLDTLGLHPMAAILGAYVITFNQWSFERALAGHAAFVHVWVLILLAGALLRMHRRATAGAAILAGLAYGLTFEMASYFGLLATLMVVGFFVLRLIMEGGLVERLWTCTLASVTYLVLGLTLVPAFLAYLSERSAVRSSFAHSMSELTRFAATAPYYLLPNRNHPFLGWLGRHFLSSNNILMSERSLFFGWTTLALAAYAVYLVVRRRLHRSSGITFAGSLFAILAPAAFIASLPPKVAVVGLQIPMPSWFGGQITTFYRVYARFGILFGIAVAVLAAIAIDVAVVRRRRGVVLTAALIAATVFQLLPGSITTWAADRPPPWDAWLARASPGIVAHYPMSADDTPSQNLALREQYYQRFHLHPLYEQTTTASLGSREGAIRLLSRNLLDPATPGVLAAEDVRYVVVHNDVYRAAHHQPPKVPTAFKQVARFGSVHIYVLRHIRPANISELLKQNSALIAQLQNLEPGEVQFGTGFYGAEQYAYSPGHPAAGLWHWMKQNGELEIHVPDQNGISYKLTGLGFSANLPRWVDLIDSNGAIIAQQRLPQSLTIIAVGPFALSPGKHRLHLYTNPPPARLGMTDSRVASVFLSPLQLQPLPELQPLVPTH